jgi:hypothetical protein
MKYKILSIECEREFPDSKRLNNFQIVVFTFDYESVPEDKILIDSLVEKGVTLANKVNPGSANDGTRKRDFERIKNNCVAGILAEYCWKFYLNDSNLIIRVSETPFEYASNQIDLQIIKVKKSIEVRSSFPRNGIPFALCHPYKEFDVIGPYATDYKPGEIKKDFYVRTLFHLKKVGEFKGYGDKMIPIIEKIMDKIYKSNFEVSLTGGADWEMMSNDEIAKNKNFIPEDELSIDRSKTASDYRVIPFSKAMDTVEIYEIIKTLSNG